jgi:hypothetical protein
LARVLARVFVKGGHASPLPESGPNALVFNKCAKANQNLAGGFFEGVVVYKRINRAGRTWSVRSTTSTSHSNSALGRAAGGKEMMAKKMDARLKLNPDQFKRLQDYATVLGTTVDIAIYEAVDDFIQCCVTTCSCIGGMTA